jgi:hypothetical protein
VRAYTRARKISPDDDPYCIRELGCAFDERECCRSARATVRDGGYTGSMAPHHH